MARTSPLGLREAEAHRVPLALPGLLQQPHAALRMIGDRLADHRLRVVLRSALDEQELRSRREVGEAPHQRLDVAGLVPARDHDAHRRLRPRREAMRRGPRDEPVHERQELDDGEVAQVPVRQVREQRDVQRHHDLVVPPDDVVVGQLEHVPHFLGREPRLRRGPRLEAGHLRRPQGRLPDPAVAVDEEARARVAHRRDGFERALDVGQARDHVDHEHDVEGAAQAFQDLRIRAVPLLEGEGGLGMRPAGGRDRGAGQVHPHAPGGPEGGEQVAGAAADVEHALAGGDPRLQHPGQVLVEVPPGARSAGDSLGMGLVEGADLLDDGLLGGGRAAQVTYFTGKTSNDRRRTGRSPRCACGAS